MEVMKPKEWVYVTKRYWLKLVQNSPKFLWIYLNIFGKDNKTNKFCFLNIKLVFINVAL